MGECEIVCNSFSGAKHLYDLCDIPMGRLVLRLMCSVLVCVMSCHISWHALWDIYCHLNNMKTKNYHPCLIIYLSDFSWMFFNHVSEIYK